QGRSNPTPPPPPRNGEGEPEQKRAQVLALAPVLLSASVGFFLPWLPSPLRGGGGGGWGLLQPRRFSASMLQNSAPCSMASSRALCVCGNPSSNHAFGMFRLTALR